MEILHGYEIELDIRCTESARAALVAGLRSAMLASAEPGDEPAVLLVQMGRTFMFIPSHEPTMSKLTSIAEDMSEYLLSFEGQMRERGMLKSIRVVGAKIGSCDTISYQAEVTRGGLAGRIWGLSPTHIALVATFMAGLKSEAS